MPVICDECDEEISLDEATEDCGEILCPACLADWDEDDEDDQDGEMDATLPDVLCLGCRHMTPAKQMIDKNPGPRCPKCAHAYELNLFTPPDHVAAECQLCTAH